MIIQIALCDEIEDQTSGLIEQNVTITYNGTKAHYSILRDLEEGGNISEVTNHIYNPPYLENGKVCYDENLTILENVFSSNDEDIADLDQILWDLDPQTPHDVRLTLNLDGEDIQILTANFTIEIDCNHMYPTEE